VEWGEVKEPEKGGKIGVPQPKEIKVYTTPTRLVAPGKKVKKPNTPKEKVREKKNTHSQERNRQRNKSGADEPGKRSKGEGWSGK